MKHKKDVGFRGMEKWKENEEEGRKRRRKGWVGKEGGRLRERIGE